MIAALQAILLTVGMVGGYIKLHRRFVDAPADEPWPGMTWREWDVAAPPF